jgi:hypothetical protein
MQNMPTSAVGFGKTYNPNERAPHWSPERTHSTPRRHKPATTPRCEPPPDPQWRYACKQCCWMYGLAM